MSLLVTQEMLDGASLVLIVGEDGLYEYSSRVPIQDVAAQLVRIAADLRSRTEDGTNG